MRKFKMAFAGLAAALTLVAGWMIVDGAIPMGLAQVADSGITSLPSTSIPNSFCYLVRGAQNSTPTVGLITQNFGRDLVVVGQMWSMCESATKNATPTVTGAPPPPDTNLPPLVNAACFKVSQGSVHNHQFLLQTPNFGNDVVTVTTAYLMCEQATKGIPGVAVLPPRTPFITECYLIRDGSPPNKLVTMDTDNFGPNSVVVGNPFLMCETAQKVRPIAGSTAPAGVTRTGNPTGEVSECYLVSQGAAPNRSFIFDTKNFGQEPATVTAAQYMCETAIKHQIISFTGSTPIDEPTP